MCSGRVVHVSDPCVPPSACALGPRARSAPSRPRHPCSGGPSIAAKSRHYLNRSRSPLAPLVSSRRCWSVWRRIVSRKMRGGCTPRCARANRRAPNRYSPPSIMGSSFAPSPAGRIASRAERFALRRTSGARAILTSATASRSPRSSARACTCATLRARPQFSRARKRPPRRRASRCQCVPSPRTS